MMKRMIKLRSGRFVSFREYGDLENGFPVIFAHGNMNSRMFEPCWGKTDAMTKEANIRLIAVDRPGYGGTDFEKGRTYLSWANDMDDLSDQLDLKKFAVAGYSSGGPHALACGCDIGNLRSKVSGICLISSDAPYKQLGAEYIKKMYGLDPPISAEQATTRTEKVHDEMKTAYESIRSDEKREIALLDLATAVEQGFEGPGYDAVLETSDWFDLAKPLKPIHIWHGDNDTDVPVEASQFLTKNLTGVPGLQVTILEGENHTLIRRHWQAILSNIHSSLSNL
mmetsp:Transcript_4161/g.6104  ORF Transcript_4161/g.6104 Transcript_4161/m.6104 type:complete len:281 (+) Transcript_4161:250-1092(+)